MAKAEEKRTRVTIAVRVTQAAADAVDAYAEAEDRTRSEIVRRMLTYASRTMPKGWKP